jgi:hypothetical protein
MNTTLAPANHNLSFFTVDPSYLIGDWTIVTKTKTGRCRKSIFEPEMWAPDHRAHAEEDICCFFDSHTHRIISDSVYSNEPQYLAQVRSRCERDQQRYWRLPHYDRNLAQEAARDFIETNTTNEERNQLWSALIGEQPLRTCRNTSRGGVQARWLEWEDATRRLILVKFFREHGIDPVPVVNQVVMTKASGKSGTT